MWQWHLSANIGRGKGRWKIREAILRVWVLATKRGVIGWQEIDEGDRHPEHRMIRSIMGGLWRASTAGWKTKVPITHNRLLWKKVEEKQTWLSKGVPGVSPARVLNEVLLKHRFTGEHVVRLNTHWIAGAWNANMRQKAEALRKEYWKDSIEITRERVHYWLDRGFNVVVSGDFNRQKPPWFHRRQVVAVEHSTDAIIAIPTHRTKNVEVGRIVTKPLGIDFHRALGARIKFE